MAIRKSGRMEISVDARQRLLKGLIAVQLNHCMHNSLAASTDKSDECAHLPSPKLHPALATVKPSASDRNSKEKTLGGTILNAENGVKVGK